MYSSDGVFPTLSARSSSGQNQQSVYLCETSHTMSNGLGIKRDDVMNTLDTSASTAVAFSQNQRNEVRLLDVPRSIGRESGMKQQSYVALDFHQQDGRAKVSDTPDVSMTITTHAGTGGNNVPMVMSDSVQTLRGLDDGVPDAGGRLVEIQGNAIDRDPGNGPGGRGYADPDDNGAYTLNTRDRHAVALMPATSEGCREGDRVMAFGWQNSSGCGLSIGDTSPTLQTEKVPAVWPA